MSATCRSHFLSCSSSWLTSSSWFWNSCNCVAIVVNWCSFSSNWLCMSATSRADFLSCFSHSRDSYFWRFSYALIWLFSSLTRLSNPLDASLFACNVVSSSLIVFVSSSFALNLSCNSVSCCIADSLFSLFSFPFSSNCLCKSANCPFR